ncbi:bifunctional UDP-N-acetylglucosamine diphosphorylase/glucosamine-1-phosphate N-acetyltransferase GlmU [bacterium]|nr:bifunctional UDP-N-acetylglucosamine diphosphorylase/glucosamine-1-phosphate N-acetyltransferase GlmU [bacterium]MBT3903611.1 bifunctional UDP-N-acetylglucosamine diphosphorylase/glucosamine-1-phosphate N-acetyltransferase GlmU [bacterium]MBT4578178.1 bifunctional UDP-N-acetylglucosamine diphosphorylase/glucosamine-1-phosphate N-acetyltransferase GlmU [bacterium]MBT5345655.1 bifunctional UDP-N-acetylglucosamine diphosphorylase/glucosamine-1-phosphate N-acetyltransferase GlmU [bacterium]MBT61
MQHSVQAVVLAAGKSTRFRTGTSKLVKHICGQELIVYPVKMLKKLGIPITLVVGYQAGDIKKVLQERVDYPINYAEQKEQRGTGHALLASQSFWQADNILVINGDMPLMTHDVIQDLINKHNSSNAAISFVTAHCNDPSVVGFGRVIEKDGITSIVEAIDFEGSFEEDCCINAGAYLIKKSFLEGHIKKLEANKPKNEFYITDLVKLASEEKLPLVMHSAPFDKVRGVNTLRELWAAEQIKRAEIITHWMYNGVSFSVAQNVHIHLDVEIGPGTYIGSGVQILRGSKIGSHCMVAAFSKIKCSTIGDNSVIHPHTLVHDSIVEDNAAVGPFAHVHENSTVKSGAKIGNFVEVRNSVIGKFSKAPHMSYLGQTQVGENVSIGAGTVTCDHDGTKLQKTHIQDCAYIGANNALVAPLTIGKASFTAAGSTITKNVPSQALAIARERQTNKLNYAPTLRADKQNPNKDSAFIPAKKTAPERHNL